MITSMYFLRNNDIVFIDKSTYGTGVFQCSGTGTCINKEVQISL